MQYDVFVVGARDPNPVAQMHLAAKLAEHFHAPAVQIAQAISGRNLRAGQSMDEAQARILCEQLANFGAVTELRPAVGGRSNTGVHPTTQVAPTPTMAGAPGTRAGYAPRTLGGAAPPPASVQPQTMGMGLAPLGLSNQTMGSGSNALGGSVPRTTAGTNPALVGRDPFAPPPDDRMPSTQVAGSPTGMLAASGTMASAMGRGGPSGGRDAFAPGTDDLPKLELAVGRGPPRQHPADSDEMMPPKPAQPSFGHDGGGGLSKLSAESAESGVELGADKIHMVRCAEHGLYYDKRTASACRKCLAPARERAAMMGKKGGPSVVGKAMKLRDDPVRHAFYGLAIALLIGLLPAAFHALAVGNPEVASLRAEQGKLSSQIGTEKTVAQYHDLDKQVRERHDANFRITALIWILGGGLGVFAWHKIT